jgi:Ca-activated chloride channel homolog
MEFSRPLWLWALLALPLILGLYFLYYRKELPFHQLEKFIDKHLIPYLILSGEKKKKRMWISLLAWSCVWSCLVVALAGPRWDFREIATFTRDQSLAILLDLSESMNAQDISPSRLLRAKQKIEDLLNMSQGTGVGLIAFAADPHMISPMTEDKETIRHLLPSLSTDLVYVQGSKLAPALEMGAAMLSNEPGNNKAIAIISDGGFEDISGALLIAKKLAEKGIVLYTIGVGSLEGGILKVKKNGSPVLSKLEKEKFREISKMGHGRYFDADHSGQEALIFEDLEKRSDAQQEAQKTTRFWEESFYLFLLPALPFFLLWYRRGWIFALLLFIPASSQAFFYNEEQKAGQAYEQGDYEAAAQAFQDPYRKGVAHYRIGDYQKAEEMFRSSARPEAACSASYNLGNALALQNKLQEAMTAYEKVLEKWPDHKEAKENLELVKKMLEEQQQEENQEEQKQEEQKQEEQNQEQEKAEPRSQEDLDADLWLDQIKDDPQSFLKNKFYLESKKNGTKEEVDPW